MLRFSGSGDCWFPLVGILSEFDSGLSAQDRGATVAGRGARAWTLLQIVCLCVALLAVVASDGRIGRRWIRLLSKEDQSILFLKRLGSWWGLVY